MSYTNEIRADLVALLKASGIASGRINSSPLLPNADDKLPCVNIYTLSGTSERNSDNAPDFDSETIVTIDIFDKGTTDALLADSLGTLLGSVLDLIMDSEELSAKMKVKRYEYETTLSIEGRARMGGVQLKLTLAHVSEYTITFKNDFEGIDLTVKNGENVAIQNTVEIPQEETE